jgi:Domain of unknown function (DUF4276)
MLHIFERERFRPEFRVDFHATKCELESWLLADENAVTRVSQERGKNRPARAVNLRLEERRDAKETFQRMLSQAGPADPAVYRLVARYADLVRIRQRCPSFERFCEKVRG